nr:MAG: ORF2 [Giant panda anellovirus]
MGSPEQKWLQACKLTHDTWCPCNRWKSHIKSPWSDTTDAEGPTPENESLSDEVMVHFGLDFVDNAGEDTGER